MRIRKTKVVATLGPACEDESVLEKMFLAGMNVARLNLSHGTHADHDQHLERLRRVGEKTGLYVAVMFDTRGPEIRTGVFEGGGVLLEAGGVFKLYLDGRPGSPYGVSISHEKLAEQVSLGDVILIDDGRIELEVTAMRREEIETRITCGGSLQSSKSVNLPGKMLGLDRMSERNQEDLRYAAERGVDYLAASFVQDGPDVEGIRAFLKECGADIPIIAKIENSSGVLNLDAIIEASNGTMVARGDLGVELPMEEVPIIQKRMIRATVTRGKPVVTATQMLDSMERNPRPTRAEVSDVANAIFDGSSAVMLSGETAAGNYPVEAVATMSKLALEAEASLPLYGYLQKIAPDPSNKIAEAVAQAAITTANHLSAAAIACLTETGSTARRISKYRPSCPILAVPASAEVTRRLAMNWGVVPLHYRGDADDASKVRFAIDESKALGYLKAGDVVVVTGSSNGKPGTTDTIRVITVPE